MTALCENPFRPHNAAIGDVEDVNPKSRQHVAEPKTEKSKYDFVLNFDDRKPIENWPAMYIKKKLVSMKG